MKPDLLSPATAILIAFASAYFVPSAHAVETYVSGATVLNIRNYTDNRFGGCVMQLDKDVLVSGTQTLTECNHADVVSLDCKGEFLSSKLSNQLFNSAQLAFVAGKKINVTVDDAKYHVDQGGNKTTCVATGIIVLDN